MVNLDLVVQKAIRRTIELEGLDNELWFEGHSPLGKSKIWSELQVTLDLRKRWQVGFGLPSIVKRVEIDGKVS